MKGKKVRRLLARVAVAAVVILVAFWMFVCFMAYLIACGVAAGIGTLQF